MASRYSIYQGKFPCHTCQEQVLSLRFYSDEKLATWLCSKKHLTEVSFNAKKNKRDHEREK